MVPPSHKCYDHRLKINIYHPAGLCKKMFEQCNGLQQEMKMIRLNDKCQLIQKRGKKLCVYIKWLFLYSTVHPSGQSIPGNDKRRLWTDPCRWRVQGPVFCGYARTPGKRSPCQDHPDGKEFRTASCASVRICPCKGRVHRNYGWWPSASAWGAPQNDQCNEGTWRCGCDHCKLWRT